MPIPPLSLVLDLDGTLVDSLPDIRTSLNLLLVRAGRRPLAPAEVRGMMGNGAERLVARALAHTAPAHDDGAEPGFLDRFLTHYTAHGADTTRCFDGVEDTLRGLRDRGHLLGVCTNKPHEASLRLIAALGLTDSFDAIVGRDAAPHHKPHPDHLWATVRNMGGEDRQVVMVGDSTADAQVAQRAGVPLVLAAYGYARVPHDQLGPAAILQRFDELPGVLERLLG